METIMETIMGQIMATLKDPIISGYLHIFAHHRSSPRNIHRTVYQRDNMPSIFLLHSHCASVICLQSSLPIPAVLSENKQVMKRLNYTERRIRTIRRQLGPSVDLVPSV
jgi:hypothetical protein